MHVENTQIMPVNGIITRHHCLLAYDRLGITICYLQLTTQSVFSIVHNLVDSDRRKFQ